MQKRKANWCKHTLSKIPSTRENKKFDHANTKPVSLSLDFRVIFKLKVYLCKAETTSPKQIMAKATWTYVPKISCN